MSTFIHLPSEIETLELGKKFAAICPASCVVFLQGELGAGKTTFVRGFLQGLGYQGKVKSPTYTLVESYNINNCSIFHFDLYRLSDPEELQHIGIRDYLAMPAILLIEWPEKGKDHLPAPDIILQLDMLGEGRGAKIMTISAAGKKLVTHIQMTTDEI